MRGQTHPDGPTHPPRALPPYRTQVIADWIDYNGHLSEAYYVLVFGFATDAAMEELGMGADYRRRSGCSLYTVESHIRYLNETALGAQLEVTTEVIGVAQRKLHLAHTMRAAGEVISTEEILGVHVNHAQGRAAVFPDDVRVAAEGTSTAPPEWVGRRVTI